MKTQAAGLLVKVAGTVHDFALLAVAAVAASSRRARLLLIGGAVALVATVIGWAALSGGSKAAPTNTMFARIVKVDPSGQVVRVAVVSNDEVPHDALAIRVSGQTQTTIEGKAAPLTDLKPNQYVSITMSSGIATKIEGRARVH
jgi:hypothetical protein